MIPAPSVTAYQAARHHAAIIDRTNRGRLVVSGSDRASYLHGLLTNDIVALAPGRGCYSAYLTAQGRMIADLWLYELGDVILVSLHRDVAASVLEKLDQFVFSEDVKLGDVTATIAQVAVVGPEAAAVIARAVPGVDADAIAALPLHGNVRSGDVTIARVDDPGEPGFDVFVERERADDVRAALAVSGAVPLDADTAEAIRVEGGVPLFHRDMDEETIPLEAGIEAQAISFTKGCYVGQEVIVRVLHRGHGRIARRLMGLRIDGGAVPAPATEVRAADRAVGEVTSAVFSPALEQPIALAYLHRDFLEPGTRVTVGDSSAEVVELPFVKASSTTG